MKIIQFPHIPEHITVSISRFDEGYFATLDDYGVFTEADTVSELKDMINDLIYELFSVPKELQHKIQYIPDDSKDIELKNIKKLVVMSTSDIYKKVTHVN